MPALAAVGLPSLSIKDLPKGHHSRDAASQHVAISVFLGGGQRQVLSQAWAARRKGSAAGSAGKRRRGSCGVRAVVDSTDPGFGDFLATYLDSGMADRIKENSRPFRRVVYDHEKWERHRSSLRFARHIWTIFASRVVVALGAPVLTLTLWATVVTLWDESVVLTDLPKWFLLRAPILPYQLTAPALALLLVFRTNSSYGRFDEARKIWGSNVNRTRDFARQAVSWIKRPQDSETLKEILRYTTAYPYALKAHLVLGQDLAGELQNVLKPAELEKLMASSHRPNHVVQIISDSLASVYLTDFQRTAMDRNLTQFHDNTGACERIFKTPIPIFYTHLVSRLLMAWHILLPFGIWDDCNVLTAPAILTSAGVLFCIDEVGVMIEEPFSILALPALCDGMKASIDALSKLQPDWGENKSEWADALSEEARSLDWVDPTPETVVQQQKQAALPVPHLATAEASASGASNTQLVTLEASPKDLTWVGIVANLVWSSFLLAVLSAVRVIFTEQQPGKRKETFVLPPPPASSPPPPEAERPSSGPLAAEEPREFKQNNDIYY